MLGNKILINQLSELDLSDIIIILNIASLSLNEIDGVNNSENLSLNEKINAISRFIIYAAVILSIYYKKSLPLYVAIALLLLTVIFKDNNTNKYFSIFKYTILNN